MVGVSSILGTNLVTMALHIITAIAGWIGRLLTPKIGHRGISISGFAIVLVSLVVAAAALFTGHETILSFVAAAGGDLSVDRPGCGNFPCRKYTDSSTIERASPRAHRRPVQSGAQTPLVSNVITSTPPSAKLARSATVA